MTPFLRGYQEYDKGIPFSDNPYTDAQPSKAQADWNDGWQAAKTENENEE